MLASSIWSYLCSGQVKLVVKRNPGRQVGRQTPVSRPMTAGSTSSLRFTPVRHTVKYLTSSSIYVHPPRFLPYPSLNHQSRSRWGGRCLARAAAPGAEQIGAFPCPLEASGSSLGDWWQRLAAQQQARWWALTEPPALRPRDQESITGQWQESYWRSQK